MLLLATLALLAPGCGGGPDPGDTVRDYLVAIVDRDGAKACGQLTAQLRQDIERSPAARRAGRSCADVMDLAAGLNPKLTTKDVEDLDVEVEEHGNRATAKLFNPLSRRHETINLVQVGGDWRISTLETRPEG
jgi:hypothetical protein